MSKQESVNIYSDFSLYIDNLWYKTILVKLIPILEEHGIAVYDEIAVIRAYKEKVSKDSFPLLHIKLYLKSRWLIDVTINSENKVFVDIEEACGND